MLIAFPNADARPQETTNRSKAKSQNARKRGSTPGFPAKSNTLSLQLLPISQADLHSSRTTKKAILAVAAPMVTAAYHMLNNHVPYHDLGADHFTRRDRSKAIKRSVRRLDLGCHVQLEPTS